MREKLELAVSLLQQVIAEMRHQEPVFPDAAAALLEARICLNCKKPIGDDKSNRGCHDSCYHRVRRRIKDQELTEFTAIESGILAPKSTPGRRRIKDDALSQAIESKAFDEDRMHSRIESYKTGKSKRKKGQK